MYSVTRQLRNGLKFQRIYYPKPCHYVTNTRLQAVPRTTDELPVFANIAQFPNKFAIQDVEGNYTYASLFVNAKSLAREICNKLPGRHKENVLFLCNNNLDYVLTLWAIWLAGHVAVPVHHQQPKSLLLYYANDINSRLIITTNEYADLMQSIAKNVNASLHVLDNKLKKETAKSIEWTQDDLNTPLPLSYYTSNNAMILYTSGTTSKPKGVVMTYKNLSFQINCLLDAWKWTSDDCILHTLPLNHVHGIINALLCPLSVGATTLMLPKFDVNIVWTHLLGVNIKTDDARRVNIFMGVPTIYSKLIEGYYRLFHEDSKMVSYIKNYMQTKIRLMVSGSAALPIPVFKQWEEITGHKLLERYGMTETGMILSNPYSGDRIPGSVGQPLPGVSIKLVQDAEDLFDTGHLLHCSNINNNLEMNPEKLKEPIVGDLLVKSDGVFSQYLNRKSEGFFSHNGFFITGDVGAYFPEAQAFKIFGRKSADIIKSGGHKISALEIESEILKDAEIKECVVVGKPDKEWGEIVVACIVTDNKKVTVESIQEKMKDTIPKYAMPRIIKIVDKIPKNTMGKVNKKDLVSKWFVNNFVNP